MRKSISMPLAESPGFFELYQLERTPGQDYILFTMPDGQQVRLTAKDIENVVIYLAAWRYVDKQESSTCSKPSGSCDKETLG